MFLYRNDEFMLPDYGTELMRGDEVVIVAHSEALAGLKARWSYPLDEHTG